MTKTATTTTGKTEAKKRTPKRSPKPKAGSDGSKLWAYAGVALMAVMSMGLNGYTNAQHSPVGWAGWGMGLAIPAIILLVARVAGLKYKAGKQVAAKIGAGVIVSLLALSVWHCATSIATLTGSHIMLALPMAIAIDCGLVYCEWATLDA